MRGTLNACAWEVKGFWPGEPLWTRSVESTVDRKGVTPWLPVSVPGGVHKALERAGLIPDPFFEQNSLLCEWVEHRWWVFRTKFSVPEEMKGQRVELIFEGLDDRAHILLNGVPLGFHEGMFEPAVYDVTDHLAFDGENRLLAVFECPPREQGQIGWTSRTSSQKARFGYKWDFCARLVNTGIWGDVGLHAFRGAKLEDVCLRSDYDGGKGWLNVSARAGGPTDSLRAEVVLDGKTVFSRSFQAILPGGGYALRIPIDRPSLWWPNGMGAQPLYTVRLSLSADGAVLDEWEGRAGVRSLSFRRCKGAPEGALPYLPVVNGKPVYIKGLNLTPLDLRYGDVRDEWYQKVFRMLQDMNANLVRVWGGGIIEKEAFYRLADEHGILVWQEFIQSSSGIENVPGHDPAFLGLLERNARSALKSRRNHVSLAFWSGGNELSGEDGLPVTERDPNIHMLGALCRELDPQRLFLPSSPSGPSFGVAQAPGQSHDVHGGWQYEGLSRHYEKYNASDSMLHSEFGTDGMSSPRALKRFLGEGELRVTSMKDSAAWRHHGEWWETLHYRDRPLFGEMRELHAWTRVSQLMQAESLRYIVQANRRRQYRNCGSIIWQLNEPFPNVSCTSLLEYPCAPKQAWYAVRKSFAPTDVSLRYGSLLHPAGTERELQAFVHSAEAGGEGVLALEIRNVRGETLGRAEAPVSLRADACAMGLKVPVRIGEQPLGLFFIRLTLKIEGSPAAEQLYCFSQLDEKDSPFSGLLELGGADLAFSWGEEGIRAKNRGGAVCPFLHGEPEEGDAMLRDSFLTLFPGESAVFVPVGKANAWRFSTLRQADVAVIRTENL